MLGSAGSSASVLEALCPCLAASTCSNAADLSDGDNGRGVENTGSPRMPFSLRPALVL